MHIIFISLLAGVIGMGAGGIITALCGSRTDKVISIFLSFAGGVMMSIVFLELIPEAIDFSSIGTTVLGLVFGAILVMALNYLMDIITKSNISSKNGKNNKNSTSKSKLHETYAEYFHSKDILTSQKSMLRSGMIMMFAIALHNIPEGLALGAAGYHDASLGLTLAIMIGLHNIPEGMATSAPLISGGFSRLKTIILVLLTGATTVIGAAAGVIVGGISDLALAMSFAIAGGAMLYVVFGEIMPQTIVTRKDRVPAISMLVGAITGMLFSQL